MGFEYDLHILQCRTAIPKEPEKLGRQLIADWRKPYPAAASNLEEHLTRLLNFYDYPSEHWRHLRTSNIIESPFAAVRLRLNAFGRSNPECI